MNDQREDQKAGAAKAAKRDSETESDAASPNSPTDVSHTVDWSKPGTAPAGNGQTCDFILQPGVADALAAPATLPPLADLTSAPATMAPEDVPSGVIIGAGAAPDGYEIFGVLGRGGMGVVYKARHIKLRRIVALKMVLAGGHASAADLERFRTEAEAIARLQHPHIVQIHDVGEQNGTPYFSLEFCGGGSLEKKLGSTPMPPREAAVLLEQLAQAMQAAHAKGVIHRDLKPANVLLAEDGTPKITDFGLAKKLDEAGTTQTGSIMGTPSYMSPEQAEGKVTELGPACDIYALGALLYDCLTGRPPFRAATQLDTIRQVVSAEPVPPTQLNAKVPRDLETICLKCLQKQPPKRYADCAALAADLQRFLAGEPILARPVGNIERLWRWCQRNPKLAAATAAVLLLLLVVSVGSTWAAIAIAAEKELAERNEQKAKDSEKAAQEQKGIAEENEQKAKTSEKVAQQQADLAVSTLGLLINKVQTQLGKQPGTQQLKRDLLQTAMNGLKEVTGGAAGKMRRATSDAYFKMGGIARELNNSADAYKYWQQYYDMAQAALKDNPGNEHMKLEMAWACRFLGEISVELGDLPKALAYYQSALVLRQELAAVPLDERVRRNANLPEEDKLTPRLNDLQLSEEYTRVGLIHYFLGDSARAEEPVLKSLALRENLVKETARDQTVLLMAVNPANGPAVLGVALGALGQTEQVSDMRQNLSRNYHLIGEIYFRLRNLKLARLYYQKCEDTREAILRENENNALEGLKQTGEPRPPDFRLMGDLAEFHQMYGAMLFSLGAPLPEVLPHLDRAIALSRKVLELDKAVGLRQNLAKALYSRGVAAVRAGDRATAAKCFQECLAIREDLADKDVRSFRKKMDLLEVLARVGAHERAAQLAEKLRLDHQKDPEFLFSLARCYAQAALAVPDNPVLRRQYLDRTLADLAAALAQGYKDMIMLETHPDLDPLRDSPAFKKLLEKVTKPPSGGVSLNSNR